MKDIVNPYGEVLRTDLELSDLEVGKTYAGNRCIQPEYLKDYPLTIIRKGRKNVFVKAGDLPNEFSVAPFMLSFIEKED